MKDKGQRSAHTPLLDVQDLTVVLPTARGNVHAVRSASFSIARGETLALVGESGCGKSVTAQALTGLLPDNASIAATLARFAEHDLLDHNTRKALCGKQIAMIFQNPMATFNPTLTLGYQIAEPLRVHRKFTRHDADTEAVRLLERMHITDARRRMHQYPHEFSGGMLQRAAIAMALAANPALLIADEPTTAVDVSTQASILALLSELRDENQLALLLITHDLRIVEQHAQRVAVMYAGEIVEMATAPALLQTPQHPYTQALLNALPKVQLPKVQASGHERQRLQDIPGTPPDLRFPQEGCAFSARCSHTMKICTQQRPGTYEADSNNTQQQARCWLYHPQCADNANRGVA